MCAVAALLTAFMAFSEPALALSNVQWTNVCTNFLGLRSAATQVGTAGAAYGMDNGNTVPLNGLRPPPAGWNELLSNMINLFKGFENSGTKYPLIVSGCPGLARDYSGAFPICNRISGDVIAATPNTLANYTAAQLVEWLNANIP